MLHLRRHGQFETRFLVNAKSIPEHRPMPGAPNICKAGFGFEIYKVAFTGKSPHH